MRSWTNGPRSWTIVLCTALGMAISSGPLAAAEPGSFNEARRVREQAVEGLASSSGDAALHEFIRRHVSKTLLAALPEAELLDRLREVRRIGAGAGAIDLRGSEDGLVFGYRGGVNADVIIGIEREAPFQIAELRIEPIAERSEDDTPPITWETLEARLDQAEAAGFAGVVLVVRDGKTVLHHGYGMANREQGLRHSTETIFDIGSTPIDFTHAAVLLLEQRGKLAASDAIAQFFPDAPADKRGITIAQLMTGRSGLPNFHHRPGVDEDFDLSPLGRDEAVARILASELLFEPGKGESHSHSAWGLLAAIVEIASGTSYEQFLKRNFFEPAGMTRTGPYGWRGPHDASTFAVGYGTKQAGQPNIPPLWGPTSWLVMGSGGMVSNPGDMLKWKRFIAGGKVLGPKGREAFAKQQILAGGTDRGFFFMYSQGFASEFFLASNAHEREGDEASRLARALARLVMEKERNCDRLSQNYEPPHAPKRLCLRFLGQSELRGQRVPGATRNLANLVHASRDDAHAGAERPAVRHRPDEVDVQPVIARTHTIVAEQPGVAEQVEIAVVVHVAKRHLAAGDQGITDSPNPDVPLQPGAEDRALPR